LSEKSGLRIGSVVIDCINFDRMLAFWQEVLHYVPRQPTKGGWVVLQAHLSTKLNYALIFGSDKMVSRELLIIPLQEKMPLS